MKALRNQEVIPSSSQLLKRVLADHELLHTVQSLPAERLATLVHSVGLEDAGELVALATTEQLQRLFDEDLWASGDAAEERFDADRFALWLEVLAEAGDVAVAERLSELPLDFVCMAVASLALVVNMDSLLETVAGNPRYAERLEDALEVGASEEWEEYRLIARRGAGFDVLISALFALDMAHHGRLRSILERCSTLTEAHAEEHGGLVKTLNRLDSIEDDVRGSRNDRRQQNGYVALADALAFLRLAALGLEYAGGRDPVTQAHFRELSRKVTSAQRSRPGTPLRSARHLIETLSKAGDTLAPAAVPGRLNRALEDLRAQASEAHALRMDELAYLANVLITASTTQVRRLRPVEAAEAVLHVCEAGLQRLGLGAQSVAELALSLEALQLDVVFRAGYRDAAAHSTDAGPLLEWLRGL